MSEESRESELTLLRQELQKANDEIDTLRAELTSQAPSLYADRMLDVTPSGIFSVDNDHTITTWNRAAAEITGYTAEEIIGKKCSLFASHPCEKHCGLFNPDISKPIINTECIFRTKAGDKIKVLKNSDLILDSEGTQIGGIESFINITEIRKHEAGRHKLEERLARSEKMEALGRLAAGVVHDLSNVLSPLVGYPDLLLAQIPDDSPQRVALETMSRSAEKAAAIIDDLLTLARRGVVNMNPLNLNILITEYTASPEYQKVLTANPGVSVNLDLEPAVKNIMASEHHILKVIMNLFSNAAEAVSKEGSVTILSRNVTIDKEKSGYMTLPPGEYVTLSVTDTGHGISTPETSRIFEPFFTTKSMGRSGTGLGLTIVHGVVEDHKGYIDIEKSAAGGTCFTVFFSITTENTDRHKTKIPVTDYHGTGTILVVDDEHEQCDIAEMMLSRLGYTVVTASSGEECIDYLKKQKVDLLIIDMIMAPGMDGFQTYKTAKTIHPEQRGIIVSGYAETEFVTEAQKLGAGEFLKKPFNLEKLGLAVQKEITRSN